MEQNLFHETLKTDFQLIATICFLVTIILIPVFFSIKPRKEYLGTRKETDWGTGGFKKIHEYKTTPYTKKQAKLQRKVCMVFAWGFGIVAVILFVVSFFVN